MIYGQNLEKILPFLNLEKQTWDRLILLKQAKKERIKVSDKEIAEIISSMPFFQQNNKFDKQTYDTILKYVFSTSAKTFETQIKDSLAIEKLISKTLEKVNVSEEELIQAYKKENETVNVSYVLFDPQKYADNVKINEEILQNYFKKHKNNFKEPAKVTFRYIQVPFDDSSDNSKVSSEEIEIYFNENKESFAEEGQETDQIKLTKDIRKKIKTAIIKYKNRLKAKNVAELISDFLLKNPDIEKASKHFSLKLQNTGFFSQYEPIPTISLSFALTQKAFSLEPKTISNALEIKDKGIFFIEVTDKKEPYIPDFKQAEKKNRRSI